MASKELDFSLNKVPVKNVNPVGKIFVYVTGGIAVAITVICAPFVSPALRKVCLPYVPATSDQICNIFKALKGRTGTLIDIGSGDGRIVIESAKNGFRAFGVEMNPWLVAYSSFNSMRNNVFKFTKFYRQDLWKHNLSSYDNVVIFGVESMMEQFEQKVSDELRDGSVLVACRFPLPSLKPCEVVGSGIDKVWKYEIKK